MMILAGNRIVKSNTSKKIVLKRKRDKRVRVRFESGSFSMRNIKNITIQRSQDGIQFYSIGKCHKNVLMEKGYIDDGSEYFKKLRYRLVLEGDQNTLIILNSDQQI